MRLAVLTALLAVYPLGVVVLRYASASGGSARPDVEITGTLQPAPAASPMLGLDVRLDVLNAGEYPVVVDQVMLTLLDGQDPVASLAEDGPATGPAVDAGTPMREVLAALCTHEALVLSDGRRITRQSALARLLDPRGSAPKV